MQSKHNRPHILLIILLLAAFRPQAQMLDVTAFGAIGDGKTDNTLVLQKAIDSSAATGRTLYFPAGSFLSGTLLLKSHTTLHLSVNAVLLGSTDQTRYPYLDAGIHFYGEEWARQCLLFGKGEEYITIEGSGTIDGQGASFTVNTTKKPDRYRNRPYLLWFAGCKNINIKGIRLRNSGFWMQHYLGCEQVHIDGINIWNHSNKNNDMMDLDGCKYVTVSNAVGDSDDDGLTIKSTSPRISEYITVTNCILSSHCNALKFGTESTGGFRNIVVSNCIIKPSAQRTTIYGSPNGNGGIALEIADGGIMENVSLDNILVEGPEVPIFIRLGNRARPYMTGVPVPPPGSVRNIHLSHITATGADATGCSLTGIPGANLEEISLSDITLHTRGEGDSIINWKKQVEEKESDYPEGTMFGKLPAYGLYIRHARDITLSNIRIISDGKDARPAIVTEDLHDFRFAGLDLTKQNQIAVFCRNSHDGSIDAPQNTPAKKWLEKENCTNIVSPK